MTVLKFRSDNAAKTTIFIKYVNVFNYSICFLASIYAVTCLNVKAQLDKLRYVCPKVWVIEQALEMVRFLTDKFRQQPF